MLGSLLILQMKFASLACVLFFVLIDTYISSFGFALGEENVTKNAQNPLKALDWTQIITTIIPTIVGGVGAFWGIFTYREAQKLKRKEILFPLIDEFDRPNKMFLAKAILDDFTCSMPDSLDQASLLAKITLKDYKHPEKLKELYHVEGLTRTLRYHKVEDDVTDPRELCVRESFDAVIDFYAKLEYLQRIGLLKKEELEHFRYYYERLENSEAVRTYVTKYGLPLKFSLFK